MLSLLRDDSQLDLRPGVVKAAAALAVVEAGMTLIAAPVFPGSALLAQPWHPMLLLLVAEVGAAAMLIIGAARLLFDRGRTPLVLGALLSAGISVLYMAFAVFVIAPDPAEAPLTPFLLGAAVFFGVVSLGILVLVLRSGAVRRVPDGAHRANRV
ncbi:hypothetical protein [Alloactinosynnema sp. L-07]|uniref:hypothetical protein n=1 Tax=Alloactinosynnema sp. L-07 TaxID=1653480 RepID=UPI00065F0019|nr:hypothetical protein [Alloactinosynnema sp. L-07]CRK58845.1 hypothetical protein [Alloactinosynnema sp. L-07]